MNPFHLLCFMSLRGTANFLLALNSTFELLHQHGHFLFVFTAFSGVNFIAYRSAVRIGTLLLIGLIGTNLSMFFTGFDRLFCVAFPISYDRMKVKPYLAVIGFICALISTFLTVLFHIGAESMPDLKVTGTIGDFLKGSAGAVYTKFALVANTLTIAIYIGTGILIRKSAVQTLSTANSFNRRIFRSLFLIVSVNIGGYFVTAAFLVFVAPLMDPVSMFFARTFVGLLVSVSSASNGPILYMTSTEHRKAFNLHFQFIFKYISGANTTVSPITVVALKETKLRRGPPSVREEAFVKK